MSPEDPPEQNPYAAPKSEVSLPETAAPEVSPEVLGKIRGAWVAGVISTVITVLMTIGALQVPAVQAAGLWHLLDVALLAILTFGIYRRSRTCAVLMFVLFVSNRYVFFKAIGLQLWPTVRTDGR